MGSVAEFYRGKAVLITGGTGFMGKVLLEKLLRSCPGVTKLYVILRPKRNKSVNERRDMLLKTQIFDYLKKTDPAQLDKVVAIPGDVMQPGLGISSADRQTLEDEVSIVFHSAATVKFDEVLKVSVTMNVKGTQSLLHLAKRMRNLEAFIHVSTAYCNCDREVIDEVVYPSPADPKKVMEMVEWLDDDVLADITPKLLGNRPNTYTYTKALAESLIVSECEDMPVAIVRPSIVTCAWKEPLPGWVDNFNGPTGMIAGAGKGLMRTLLCHEDLVADVVPVDVPINLMITAAWYTAVRSPRHPTVYNCASGSIRPIRWREVRVWGELELRENPMCNVLWYPGGSFTSSPLANKFWVVVCHFIPAYILDAVIMLCGHKPLLVRIHKRMLKASNCLTYFTTHQWTFKSNNVLSLLGEMSEHDRQEFHFDMKDLDWRKYLAIYCIGVRRFILKEDDDMEKSRRHLRRMYYVQEACRLLFFLLTWRTLLNRSETARALWSSLLTLLRSMMPAVLAPLTS
ncbi:putative fatty acyl-CoA reductase CG5065 [Amphibalanus amphitrite]|uniref:putative fatty acyl-CoA reductase CG5065 n=1 Tax=Amphibalanus amphitrite TaxID=1232801 RepID=UPI001C912AF7|nr:putative fatty acyl-CoA reductase CG5065 [Amphibalanus amphitrite]XP_043242939.1 putative fatty acyl-CoA reductase CG5065 [Amphibalanus amphitrite]